ncbi:DUF4142 domain-containing protein [Deinococcus sonorensis]|uniref:DUF4142 domain-containing protein n=2 Tax=Deinococcus sonorensis TaxID=309891 RepID=A0AAU7UAB6_9DEIO
MKILPAAVMLSLALASCAPMMGMGMAPASMDPDTLFEQAVAGSNMFEIKTSQLALAKSSSAAVKSFAQQMIDDHTKAQAQLEALAKSQGVPLPTMLPPDLQIKVVTLSGLNGAAFDTAYIQEQTLGHQLALSIFQNELTAGKKADTRNLATALLPAIQMHLQEAQALKP